ncbi:beta-N-acetylhexosaminidase [Belliella kenyensis]|uniref:beta-N-acetylhexosaminidase n=1 Tax=Belliella kenyensis TaxID=1472724 RepID=A0ABV8EQ38_9BACT|nr:beta-N-acetylhexosaminidase [Belliella kenyensis]MCH7401999.1 beta-N-acetylhexosaminidase [Belliella kenyensis]MDN3605163.1 beta-N-acetylhexosaminidase [Belliella kenyensis]
MKKDLSLITMSIAALVLTMPFCRAQIIPHPQSIEYGSDLFEIKSGIEIIADLGLHHEAAYLAEFLEKGFGEKSNISKIGNGIILSMEEGLYELYGKEGYQLIINDQSLSIMAATSTGVFYGIQSLKQLFPTDFECGYADKFVAISSVEIIDKPRFSWRAFMLDESRHFMGIEQVKKMLDQMAALKMNTFHWHLTDDQGWRIEIKKYPKLTSKGSVRNDTQVERNSEKRFGKPHEGFYTQVEIKEIITYAKDRHITIVPEIEMPGHAMAAIAAYPWLGSLGTTTQVPETFGKMPDSFNVADAKVVSFLLDVLDEVIALFPGQTIHIGGDEVNYQPWENDETVKEFMAKQNLNSPVDLQIYFTNQVSNYLESAGKRMMGWNEIMGDDIHEEREASDQAVEQKLAASSIVHFWKGDLSLIQKAVMDGYQVVNSNHWDTYLDYTYERLPISKSYAFNPIPEGLEEKYHSKILGTGTQIWTEYTPTIETLERQVFPRLIAYAEVGWTFLENKDFERFQKNLSKYKERLQANQIQFHEEMDQ